MRPFDIPGTRLRSLGETRPEPGGAAALTDWLHSTRLVLLKTLLTRADRSHLPAGRAHALHGHWALLEDAEHHDPGAVRGALGYPAVGNWLAYALDAAPGRGFARALAGLGPLAATVATAAGRDLDLDLATLGGRLTLPGLGACATTAPRVRLTAAGDRLVVTPQGAEPVVLSRAAVLDRARQSAAVNWRPLHTLPGGRAVLDDQDPHLFHRADRERLAGLRPATLTEPGEAARWQHLWQRALRLLREADPERAAEVTALVRAVVPVLWKPDVSASATQLASPWAVLTTRPRTPEEMAEVLVHEVQHSKLAVLGGAAHLHHQGAEAVYRIGWRSDPRPLGAVVQGTYAHLALADLWARLARRATATPAERAAALRRSAHYGEQVDYALFLLLGSGQLTAQGTEFVEGMRRRHVRLGAPGGRGGGGAREAADTLTNGHFG